MRRLIRADLRRIFRKKSYYIFASLMCLFIFFWTFSEEPSEQVGYLHENLNSMCLLFISLPLILSVYGDELRSGTMQGAIGRGLSRTKLIRGKMTDCAVLAIPLFATWYLTAALKNLLFEIVLTSRQYEMLLIYLIISWIKLLIILAISAMFILLSWNAVLGIFIDLLLLYILDPLLKSIQVVTRVPVRDGSFYGLLDKAYAAIEAGNPAWQLPVAVIVYLCFVIILTGIIFERKELPL